MTSTPPTAGVPPPPPPANVWGKKSFADVVANRDSIANPEVPLSRKEATTFKGMPQISFPDVSIQFLASKHKLALIGYFFKHRPEMKSLRKAFDLIGFKGSVHLGLLEKKHVLIRFEIEEDYIRCWNRQFWDIFGSTMRVTKWTPDFKPNVESPVVPVWLALEGLPIHLQDRRALFDIVGLIGRPLKLDAATTSLARPSVARVFAEVDVSKTLPNKVWINCGSSGFAQSIVYENRPLYCNHCLHLGHSDSVCIKKKERQLTITNGEAALGDKTDTKLSKGDPKLTKKDAKFSWVAKVTGSQREEGQTVDKGKAKVSETVCLPSSSRSAHLDEVHTVSDDTDTEEVYHEPWIPVTDNNAGISIVQNLQIQEVQMNDNHASPNNSKQPTLQQTLLAELPGLKNSNLTDISKAQDDLHIQCMVQHQDFDPEKASKEYASDSDIPESTIAKQHGLEILPDISKKVDKLKARRQMNDSELLEALMVNKETSSINELEAENKGFITVGKKRGRKPKGFPREQVISAIQTRNAAKKLPQASPSLF
ncbi:unnamed protein product [Cuscuta epithymum]|uniref:DUF4283 domain-containing protein n=1 Tax=Cuscuta epithymum TaxID=186058 RepID=A0AAV0EQ55_9ASTE|nr:unnamed protein product [Cuscuta epithymum]